MKRILVIDDDTYMCNLVVNFLHQNGYQATGVYNGNDGRNLIMHKDFDLVLCDFRLPDTDGTEILNYIKQKKPSVQVIIITAYSDIKMAVSLIKSGAFDYILAGIAKFWIDSFFGEISIHDINFWGYSSERQSERS